MTKIAKNQLKAANRKEAVLNHVRTARTALDEIIRPYLPSHNWTIPGPKNTLIVEIDHYILHERVSRPGEDGRKVLGTIVVHYIGDSQGVGATVYFNESFVSPVGDDSWYATRATLDMLANQVVASRTNHGKHFSVDEGK